MKKGTDWVGWVDILLGSIKLGAQRVSQSGLMFPVCFVPRLYRSRTMASLAAHSSHFKPVSISYPSLLSSPAALSHSIGKSTSQSTLSATYPIPQSRLLARVQTVWELSSFATFLRSTQC
jgi:hypothetical protein